MRRELRSRPLLKLFLMVLVMGAVAAACSAADSGETLLRADDDSVAEVTVTIAAAVRSEESNKDATAASSDELGAGGIAPTVLQTTDLGRDIIFTADLTVAVTDVAGAGEEATRLIQGMGGFLFGQRTVGSPDPTSILTFKVQPEDFSEALSRLGAIGEIRSQNVFADDVTERIVDLGSRIDTAEASVERLRALLDEATDIKAIVAVETELLARETQLETLRGQLRTLEDQVSLATITLTLTEAASRPELILTVTAYPAHDNGLSCPGSSHLGIEQNTEATVCFEITNVGDTFLSGFDLRDPVLDVEIEDLIVVFGDPTAAIEPGESIILATEVVPERTLRTQTTVTAQPVNEEGEPVPGRPAANTVTIFIETVDPGGIPGFSEGLETSWELLVRLGQVMILLAGAVIPFFWIPLILWLFLRMRRNRSTEKASDAATETETAGTGKPN
jgi:hypothetical protein